MKYKRGILNIFILLSFLILNSLVFCQFAFAMDNLSSTPPAITLPVDDIGNNTDAGSPVVLSSTPPAINLPEDDDIGNSTDSSAPVNLISTSSAISLNIDDYGNSISSAAPVELNQLVPGSIEEPGDVDFFKIVITRPVMLEVCTTGDTDTFGELMDDKGNLITSDDDSGTLKNFDIHKEVDPGVYFVSVRDYYADKIGAYILNTVTTDIPADDYGNNRDYAFDIQSPAKINGNIEVPGDIDYFKVNVPGKGFVEIFTQGNTDTLGCLEDSQGNIISTDDDSGGIKNFRIYKLIDPGSYYISVRDYYDNKCGAYELNVNINMFTDDYGNDMNSAAEISTNNTSPGGIQYDGDIDFFKLNMDEKGMLNIFTSGSTDTYGVIYNSNGQIILEDDDGGTDKNFNMSLQVDPGIYFVSVKDYYENITGSYTLTINKTPYQKDEYGNSITEATSIDNITGINGGIQFMGDIDFFKFNVSEESQIDLYTTGNTDTYGSLYDASGTLIVSNDDDGENKNFEIKYTLNPGTYYIEVKDYYPDKIGEYSLFLKLNSSQSEQNRDDYYIETLNPGDNNSCAFEYDGIRYAYIGCNTTPARIVKFDLQDMKRVSSIDLPANENRDECRVSALISISPDSIIHASYTNPCVFTKIDVNTMQITGTLEGAIENTNDKYIRTMAYDGKYVYAATYTTPGKIIKFDPVTMKRVDSCTFSDGEASLISKIIIIGDYIIGVCDQDTDQDSRIFRIKKDNLHEAADSFYVSGLTNYHSLCTDGRYAYAATDTNPLNVVKIDPIAQQMTVVGTYIGEADIESGNYSITSDGTNIIIGTWNYKDKDKLIKIDSTYMNKIGIMDFLPSYPADLTFIAPYIYTCTDNATGSVVRLIFH